MTVVPFGHVGDGNIHLNVVLPAALSAERAAEQGRQISQAIYDIVLSLGGTFSAEHGIGRAKVGLLESKRDPVELDLMRRIKAALDEDGSFNPARYPTIAKRTGRMTADGIGWKSAKALEEAVPTRCTSSASIDSDTC